MPHQIRIIITGLGPAGLDWLPPRVMELLTTSPRLMLRTERHPAALELRERGVGFSSLDPIYNSARRFETLYRRLAAAVVAAAREGPVVYAVPGNPLFGEQSVRLLLERSRAGRAHVSVVPAPGFTDAVGPALAAAGCVAELTEWQVADAAALEEAWWDPCRPVLIFQVDDLRAASRVKLAALEEYPDAHPTWVVRAAGCPGTEDVRCLPLSRIDHPQAATFDHLTTLYLPPLEPAARRPGVRSLVEVMARLRAPDGCPWDREQSPATLKRYVLEEAYEVLEAVDSGDADQLCEELGDLLLQVVFLAQMAAEEGHFDLRDVATGITEKLIRRHPHVFGDASVDDAAEVLRNWDAIKRLEKPERASALDGVPPALPALLRALQISKRAVRAGFEWPSLDSVLAKLDEELAELRAEISESDPDRLESEVGDLLFTVVNVARWLRVDPEEALRRMVIRFEQRFRAMEAFAAAEGQSLGDGGAELLSIEELDRLWERAKRTVG